MRTHPKTAISDYMFMEWRDEEEQGPRRGSWAYGRVELEPKAFMRGFWASREVKS